MLVGAGERDADGSRVLESVPVKLLDGLLKAVPVQQLRGGSVAGSTARADRVALLEPNLKILLSFKSAVGDNVCLNF